MKLNGNIIRYFLFVLLCGMTGCVNPAAIEEAPALQTTQSESVLEVLDLEPNVDIQTVASVLDREDVFLLDVREQWEYDAGHIAGNTLIPIGSVPSRLGEIPKDQTVIVYCHSGARSQRVANFLTEQGYTNIHNMLGGIAAWQQAGFQVQK